MRTKYFVKGFDKNGRLVYTDYTFNKDDIKMLFKIVRRQARVNAVSVGDKIWNLV